MRRHRLRAALVLGVVLAPVERPFTDELWEANRDVYEAILAHPFLTELAEGRLDRRAFAFYMLQDAHYLRGFARALNLAAIKAPRESWAATLSAHAASTLEYERKLHESVFEEYGIGPEQVASFEPAPEAFAYTSYLVATAFERPFEEGLAALLPCYWIYWEVGKEFARRGSKDPVYQKWIDQYSSEQYGETVRVVLDMTNAVAAGAPPERRAAMARHFRRSARYEWMFWDSAYHRRGWPPPSAAPGPSGTLRD